MMSTKLAIMQPRGDDSNEAKGYHSELSRMGRSVGEIITTVDALVKQQIRFGELTSYIAHNMRNPLASIRAAA